MHINLVNFNIYTKRFILLLIIGFILSIALKLHGLSVNMWDNCLPSEKYTTNNILLGKARGIRSDDLLVSTPFILSQIKHDFPQSNSNIGVDKAPATVHYNLPVYHFSSLFKPQNFGFFIGKYFVFK